MFLWLWTGDAESGLGSRWTQPKRHRASKEGGRAELLGGRLCQIPVFLPVGFHCAAFFEPWHGFQLRFPPINPPVAKGGQTDAAWLQSAFLADWSVQRRGPRGCHTCAISFQKSHPWWVSVGWFPSDLHGGFHWFLVCCFQPSAQVAERHPIWRSLHFRAKAGHKVNIYKPGSSETVFFFLPEVENIPGEAP